MNNYESFVFYESFFSQMQRLEATKGVEVAYEFVKALCDFGLYGVIPEDENEIWIYGLEQSFTSIEVAKDRYNKAIEDGAKGGRKKIDIDLDELKELKESGWSNSRIARQYGVSESTISRRCKEITWQDPFSSAPRMENPQLLLDEMNQNSQNHSVSENLNVNDNVNINLEY